MKIMIRQPDMFLDIWKIEVIVDEFSDVKEMIAFCDEHFGHYSKTPELSKVESSFLFVDKGGFQRWSYHIIGKSEPVWMDLYFRDSEDVMYFKLRYAEYFVNE